MLRAGLHLPQPSPQRLVRRPFLTVVEREFEGGDARAALRVLGRGECRAGQRQTLASELVKQGVVVLATTGGTNSVLAAKSGAPELPIVFAIGGDPLKFDLVRSLNQPGGNVTGATFLANALLPKQFALLYEIAQRPRKVGFMVNPANPNAEQNTADVVAASASVGSELIVVQASTREEVEQAFAKFQLHQIGALVIFPDALFTGLRDAIATLALRAGIPTIYNSHEFAIAGGFVGYGPDQMETYRQAGRYVGRVLSGEKVSALPVMQPTKFELFINLKTAKALNLGVPPNLLALADEVIE